MTPESRIVWFLLDEASRFARWKEDPRARGRHKGLIPHELVYETQLAPLVEEAFSMPLILAEKATDEGWDTTVRKALKTAAQALAMILQDEPDLAQVCSSLSDLYSHRCHLHRLSIKAVIE